MLDATWQSSNAAQTLAGLCAAGHAFLICPNTALALPDGCADEVITNNLPPFDSVTFLGPTVQTAEIQRILKSGGIWTNNGQVWYVKP